MIGNYTVQGLSHFFACLPVAGISDIFVICAIPNSTSIYTHWHYMSCISLSHVQRIFVS